MATSGPTLGRDLRALRKSRGWTLASLSSCIGRSVGWLSQVERDLSRPSIDELREIADALSVPVSILFGQPASNPEETGYVVRRDARRKLGRRDAGLVEELLSPDLTDDFEVVHSVFEAGAAMDRAVVRKTTEVGYIVSGKLDLEIAGRHSFTLHSGDSFRFRGESYRWSNPYARAATAIWVVAPPVY
ncbi:MAG: XRE family transcriptional regulator [Paracoccaceae bacterium]|nr:XRE family transcriptional regulator [Paracoccaceae bacterium]MDE2912237.1 XRE family transcriptional regulator [Paracoccaceae bacterium]